VTVVHAVMLAGALGGSPGFTASGTGRAWMPLVLTLPPPAFSGTPKNIPPGTTVEKPTGRKRPPVLVPRDVTNVSRGRPVTADGSRPVVGELEVVTDGDKETADGAWVELGPGVKFVQLDLGRAQELFAVVVWHYHGDPRVTHDVVVQTAEDPDFITGVRTLFNNDQDNSAGLGIGKDREYFETFEGKLVEAGGARGRYLRLYSHGSTADDLNRYTEVEVYGRPVP